MDGNVEHWVILISTITSSIIAIIGAVFAGFIALKQIPKQNEKAEAIHSLINGRAEEAQLKIDSLQEEVHTLRRRE